MNVGESFMLVWIMTCRAFLCVCIFATMGIATQAQTISNPVSDLALKSGESTELSDVYWINSSCKSILKGTPEVEILDGPSSVTATIKPASIVPRVWGCAKAVQGGKLVITAKEIEDQGSAMLLLRVNYKTQSGERQRSITVRLALIP
jgi:hypothetical protein